MIKCENGCDLKKVNNQKHYSKNNINSKCPICFKGRIYFEGYCPDCNEEMKLKERKEIYKCENCNKKHSPDQVMNHRKKI